jgi:hypothetical protein
VTVLHDFTFDFLLLSFVFNLKSFEALYKAFAPATPQH